MAAGNDLPIELRIADAIHDFGAHVYDRIAQRLAQRRTRQLIITWALLVFFSALAVPASVIAACKYYSWVVPDRVRTVPVYLQYEYEVPAPVMPAGEGRESPFSYRACSTPNCDPNPYGMADIRDLDLRQDVEYDVAVTLTLPRSPPNLDRGNFMIELLLLTDSRGADVVGGPLLPLLPRRVLVDRERVSLAVARPALVTHVDPLVSLASRLLWLPYYAAFAPPGAASTQQLEVPMAEAVSFRRGLAFASTRGAVPLPDWLFLEVKAGQGLQTYAAEVRFEARMGAVVRLMHRHPTLTVALLAAMWWGFAEFLLVLQFVGWNVPWRAWAGSGGGDGGDGPGGRRAVVKKEKSPAYASEASQADALVKHEDDEEYDAGGESSSRSLATILASSSREDAPVEEGGYEEDVEDQEDEEDTGRTTPRPGSTTTSATTASGRERRISGSLRRRSSQGRAGPEGG